MCVCVCVCVATHDEYLQAVAQRVHAILVSKLQMYFETICMAHSEAANVASSSLFLSSLS